MLSRFFGGKWLLVVTALVPLVLSGCSSNPRNDEQEWTGKILEIDDTSPDKLAQSVVNYLNEKGEINALGLKWHIREGYIGGSISNPFLKTVSPEVSRKLEARQLIYKLLVSYANNEELDNWYLHGCQKSFDNDLSSSCYIFSNNWDMGPLELRVSFDQKHEHKDYVIDDLVTYINGISTYERFLWIVEMSELLGELPGSEGRDGLSFLRRSESKLYSGEEKAVIEDFHDLPETVKENKFFKMLFLDAALINGDTKALREVAPLFISEGDPQTNMSLRTYYYLTQKEFGKSEKALDDLDQKIGVSFYSRFQKVNLYYESGRYYEALDLAIRLLREQPENEYSYYAVLLPLVASKDFGEAADMIELMSEKFDYPLTENHWEMVLSAGEVPNQQAFLSSPEMKAVLQ
ncbi:hypothetical protein M3P05_10785 [Sansalvadorimonas sp. 2012CJ34-2]|uniref:Tetratricopeptide repeat protein n=1 Tax=Parendozoicomonas callyspongiae TaxID=2942213 RepID=A0ABT0PGB9_9GAMM|nr:hypothetical protein [Sansalvadorimonas sp. 2012CJ34-2]MCL6270405.1 hypothetical protein [Sansalvadorimonas sp. 2012CJ34-2]